jgi:serine/threonine-protein kinase
MGIIYKARDTLLDRPVALKFLPSHLGLDEEAKARFVHEAKAASALDHPNVCTIYEFDATSEDRLFIAMAYYSGESLKAKSARAMASAAQSSRIPHASQPRSRALRS